MRMIETRTLLEFTTQADSTSYRIIADLPASGDAILRLQYADGRDVAHDREGVAVTLWLPDGIKTTQGREDVKRFCEWCRRYTEDVALSREARAEQRERDAKREATEQAAAEYEWEQLAEELTQADPVVYRATYEEARPKADPE